MKGKVLAAAALSLALTGCGGLCTGSTGKVKCVGGNHCKGMTACKGSRNTCKGMNSCKGKGHVHMSRSACVRSGGTPH